MTIVIVAADEAATLFIPKTWQEQVLRDGAGWELFNKPAPMMRRFVVHTANIEATTCETCEGYGWAIEDYTGRHIDCSVPACIGGTVPAVVTLAVPCSALGCDGYGVLSEEQVISGGYVAEVIVGNCDCVDGCRPVGTATVRHCWPIVGLGGCVADVAHVCMSVLFHMPLSEPDENGETETDITGQVVGNPQPGQWLLELDNASPVGAAHGETAPPTTTPPGGGLAEIVAGVSAAAHTPATNNNSGGEAP